MIALDIEGTSPDVATGSILSLGAVDTDDPNNQFYDECRAFEGAHIAEEALAVNGFTKEEATDPSKKSEAELVASFMAWATDRPQNRTLVGQNISFDYDYLRHACKRGSLEFPFAKRTLDIHSLVWLHMTARDLTPPVGNHHSIISLDFALRYVGIPEEPKPHNALTGALSHAEVFSRVAYNRKILSEFSDFEIPWLNP
jgi:DNA polymerase III epsilon subunit-like protein